MFFTKPEIMKSKYAEYFNQFCFCVICYFCISRFFTEEKFGSGSLFQIKNIMLYFHIHILFYCLIHLFYSDLI